MAFSFFILGFLVAPHVAWWWFADRRLHGRPGLRVLLAVLMVPLLAQVLWIIIEPDTARRAHHWLPEWWMAYVYIWFLLVLPVLLVASLVTGAVRVAARRPVDPTRRRLLKAGVAFAPPLAAGVAMASSLDGLHDFRVRRLAVPVDGLPAALDGLAIAHVTDVHYGKFTTPDLADRVVAATNALGADLVLLTGDLIDLSLADLPAALALVKRLHPRRGLFLCEGNHDRIQDGDAFAKQVKAAGLPLLLDEAATVEVRGARVQVLGATWQRARAARAASLDRLRALRDDRAFPILLAHHPHVFDLAEGFPLTLCGHTHGGQLMWNERLGAGPVIFRYWSGAYRRDGRALVVSNGVGNWFPVRARAPAEILRVTLVRA